MKRIDKNKLQRNFISYSVLSILLILTGIIIPCLIWFVPPAPYEAYGEKTVVIEKFYKHTSLSYVGRFGSRTTRVYRIDTKDGQTYNLNGQFDLNQLEKTLQPGVVATIRWANNPFNFFAESCEELKVGSQILVRYDNDEPPSFWGPFFIGLLFISSGIVIFLWARWYKNHVYEIERKRDLRIAKKYCKNESAVENFENKQKEKKS